MRISDWSSDVCSSDLEVRSATTRADKDRKRFLWLSRMGTFRSAHFVFNFPTNLSHEGGLSVITCTLAWPSLDKMLRQADASSSDVTNTKASMPEVNDEARSEEHTSELHSLMHISSA